MKLDSLKIEQFRGIKNLNMNKLSDVNLLLGNNDAGKTSVLEAIELFEAPSSIDTIIRNAIHRIPSNGLYMRDYYSSLECLLHLFPLDQEHKQISLCAEFDDEICNLQLTGELLHIQRLITEEESRVYPAYINKHKEELTAQDVLTFVGILNSCGKAVPVEVSEFYRYRIPTKQIESLYRPIGYMAPGDHLSGRINSSVYKTSKKQETEIVKLLRLIDSEIEGIKLQPNSTTGGVNQVIEHRRFGNVPLYTYGDGMKKILSLAAAVLMTKGGILLIDEIETSLQASNLKRVFSWLLHACRQFNVQLFATTHSLESISALVSCAVEDVTCELSCYRLEKVHDDTFAKRFSESELDFLVNGRGMDVR